MKPSDYPHYHLFGVPAAWWRRRYKLACWSWKLVGVWRGFLLDRAITAYFEQWPGGTIHTFMRQHHPAALAYYEAWYWAVYWEASCAHLCPCSTCRSMHLRVFGEEQSTIHGLEYNQRHEDPDLASPGPQEVTHVSRD